MTLRKVWFMLAVLGTVVTAHAQAPNEQGAEAVSPQAQDYRDKAARGLFEAGSAAFEEGRYEEALDHFRKAYELSPTRHLLLYNIASSLDRLRRDEEALSTFMRYLELNPTASNRSAVEARVRLLQDAVKEQREAESAQTTPAPTPSQEVQASPVAAPVAPAATEHDDSGRGLSPVFTYVGAGLTAVAATLTIVSGLNTNNARDSYESYSQDPRATAEESKRLYDDGIKRQTRTNVLAGVTGAVGVATAVVAIFFTRWHRDQKTKPQVSVSANQFRLGVSHDF